MNRVAWPAGAALGTFLRFRTAEARRDAVRLADEGQFDVAAATLNEAALMCVPYMSSLPSARARIAYTQAPMRILTYNLRQLGKREQWLGLDSESPDLLLLQESNDPATYAATDRGSWLWTKASTTKFGSALWSRSGTLSPIPVPDYEGWIALARIERHATHPAPFLAASLHAPGHLGPYIRTVGRMLDALAPLCRDCPTVIGGDFNMATGRRDQGEALATTPAERRVLDRIEREFRLTGCWQAANPGQPLPQTLRWVANPETAYHCDGIFIPQQWTTSLLSCAILAPPHPAVVDSAGRAMSDHNPVMAELEASC